MSECRFKKRLQFYLDGWADGRGARDIEKHLKQCPLCQVELAELEELGGAAQEIIEQAPDKAYWDSFSARVRNRIFSRNVKPVSIEQKAPRFLLFRLASALMVILGVTSAIFILLRQNVSGPNIARGPEKVIEKSFETANMTNNNASRQSSAASSPSSQSELRTLYTAGPSARQSRPIPVLKPASNIPSANSETVLSIASPARSDITELFRQEPLFGQAQFRLETDAGFPVRITDAALIDPSYRLRSSFIGQRLMAGLGMDPQSNGAAILTGPLYGFNSSTSTFAWDDFKDDVSSSWGYLRIASDTSRSNEIKKYFIELEIMQSR